MRKATVCVLGGRNAKKRQFRAYRHIDPQEDQTSGNSGKSSWNAEERRRHNPDKQDRPGQQQQRQRESRNNESAVRCRRRNHGHAGMRRTRCAGVGTREKRAGTLRNVGEIIRFNRQMRKGGIGAGSLECGGCRNVGEIIRINRQMEDGIGAGSLEFGDCRKQRRRNHPV